MATLDLVVLRHWPGLCARLMYPPPGIPAYVLLTLPTTIVQLSIVPAGNQIAGSGVRWR
jgi:hypothetical protein